MGENIEKDIIFFNSKEDAENSMKGMWFRPDGCPFCQHSISAEYILLYNKQF